MRISLNWLKEYTDVPDSPAELAHRLTMAGIEVSSLEVQGEGIGDVVVAQILERGRHPDADRLSLCKVTDGAETYDIVCGASNMKAGDRVALARVGAKLPGGMEIRKAKIRGQLSFGMMCSERELGLSESHEGILILPVDAPLGQPLIRYLGLPDAILEVEITPNRPDCLSVVGVAREIAALTGGRLKVPEPVVPESGDSIQGQTSVEIFDADLCHRYAARLIRGVRLGPSPQWMKQRLLASGVRSISNVVDVTNYVLLELGHPLHAFDFAKLRGGRIVVKRAMDGERFTTLDGQERILDRESLTICDAEGAVALAGIMGGLNSEVGEDTVDVLLESAWFLPTNIRRTSKRLGLRSEASYRFERGTDVEGLMRALDRAAQLIVELAGGTAARGIWDAYPTKHDERRVTLRPAKATAVLGSPIDAAEAVRCLAALGMEAAPAGPAVEVVVPSHRVDVEREIDLIEEIARVRGYDAIPETLPRIPMAADPAPAGLTRAEAARQSLAGLGLREAITLSFIDQRDDDRLGLAAESPLRSKVTLQNPLSSETSVLRTSLLPGLLKVARLNARRQSRDLRLFEVGKTFHPVTGQELPLEVLRAGGILSGRRHGFGWWAGAETTDFYDGKGVFETLLAALRVRGAEFSPADEIAWLQPGRAARVSMDGRELGWIGEIHPDRLDAFELAGPVTAFEADLDACTNAASGAEAFQGLARFPAVERDIAVLVDRGTAYQALSAEIRSAGTPLLRSVGLFDAFEGGKLPVGKLSLAFRLNFRSDERTLTEEEVAQIEQSIIARLVERFGARLRDA